ncbi:unnamed protein product [Linum tenue]|uniref:Transmembrane protein n=1 Tax=Linum tenue TaxID=586396 RepID=A0AAV0QTD1_9ROSI|nr:unnamed protein product [Linum tenue]
MASTSRHVLVIFLLLSVLIGLLSTSVSAGRPCKTLYISSYTVSVRPLHSFRYPNPNFGRRSAGFVAIVTEIGHQSSSESSSTVISDRAVFPGLEFGNHVAGGSRFVPRDERQQEEHQGYAGLLPFGLSSHEMSSLRDRTKDILSVVVALLFGVGCGALTAATMYLVWSLFAVRSAAYYDELYDDDEEEEEDASPKKMGYVKIPEAEKVAAPVKAVV